MKTEIIKIDPNEIDVVKLSRAAEFIRQGKLVVFPTETVYGLGANAYDENACNNIFKAKGRPGDNPLIVHVVDMSDVEKLSSKITNNSKILAQEFWPGPLTMIFDKSDQVSDVVTAKLDTVAIRMPAHKIAKKLIELAGVPIAAPSANTSGKPSPTIAKHVIDDLYGKVDMIIDGGNCQIGLESTVLDATANCPCILRPGGITKEEIVEKIGDCKIDPAIISSDSKVIPKSPGQKYRHYSPKAKIISFKGDLTEVSKIICDEYDKKTQENLKIGIIATKQSKEFYGKRANVKLIGDRENPETIANKLFEILRDFDDDEVDIILSETFDEEQIGQAIMNRLDKATTEKILV